MISQQMCLWNEPESESLPLFPVDSPVSPSLSPESAEEKTTNGSSGPKCSELSENCTPPGSLGRMCLDLFESRLTRFFPGFKRPGTKQGPTVAKLGMSADCSVENGSLLWPRPTTGAPLCGGTGNFKQMERLRDAGIITEEERRNLTCGSGGMSNPDLMAWLMGFPIGWTDLDAMETP